MSSMLRLATVFLFSAILGWVQQSTKPQSQTEKQTNPCDWAMSQQEMNQCSGDQYRKADFHLNAVYGKLMGFLEKDLADAQHQNDAEQKRFVETAIQKLKAAEKAWLEYRDLHCDAARHEVEGGSMSPMVWASCMETVTNHRIEELKDAYETGDQKLE